MRGRVLILIGLIVLGGGAVVALLLLSGGGGEENGDTTPAPAVEGGVDNGGGPNVDLAQQLTPTLDIPAASDNKEPVLIAIQPIQRGDIIREDMVGLRLWPRESIPLNSFADPSGVVGSIARSDIPLESPIVNAQLITLPDGRSDLASTGSDLATLLPPGKVAVTVPLDYTGLRSVAWGMQPGDSVDVVMNFLFIDVDEEFQTRLPNAIIPLIFQETVQFFNLPAGRIESDPNIPFGSVIFGPNAEDSRQRPRLVTQVMVQGALVLYINWLPEDGRLYNVPSPTPFVQPAGPAPTPQPGAPTATVPVESVYDEITPFLATLAVDPQEALVLAWAIESQIPLNFFLRSAREAPNTRYNLQAVTLSYIIQQYGLPRPQELRAPFALEPAIYEVPRFDLRTISFFVFSN